jgi:hypothetical protein
MIRQLNKFKAYINILNIKSSEITYEDFQIEFSEFIYKFHHRRALPEYRTLNITTVCVHIIARTS